MTVTLGDGAGKLEDFLRVGGIVSRKAYPHWGWNPIRRILARPKYWRIVITYEALPLTRRTV